MMRSRTLLQVEKKPGLRNPAEIAMEASRKRSRAGSLHNDAPQQQQQKRVYLSQLKEEEVADILVRFDFYRKRSIGWNAIIGEWGARRHRSPPNLACNASEFPTAKYEGSPTTPLSVSLSAINSDYPTDQPCPPARLAAPASKRERSRKTSDRRRQRKPTPKEYRDMLNTLSLENQTLKQAVEQMSEERQRLKEKNERMTAELELKLRLRVEEKVRCTLLPASSCGDLAPETSVSLGGSPFLKGQRGSDQSGTMLRLSFARHEVRSIQRRWDPCSPESPSGSEKGDSLGPGEDAFCHSEVQNMNASSSGILHDGIPSTSEDQMHPSENKAAAAANARRRRIELKRDRNARFHKTRLKLRIK